MGYPTFEAIDESVGDVALEKGIVLPFNPRSLQLNQSRGLSRGGSAAYVTSWGEPTRIIKVSIKNISDSSRTNLHDFFEEIDYSVNSFNFYPKGKDISDTSFFSSFFDTNFFSQQDTTLGELFRVKLWQDDFNMPYVTSTMLANIDELNLLVEGILS